LGQDPALFRDITLREYDIVCEAAGRRDAHLAWLAAKYNSAAYHNPSEMPDDPALPQVQKMGNVIDISQTEAAKADSIAARAAMKAWANRS